MNVLYWMLPLMLPVVVVAVTVYRHCRHRASPPAPVVAPDLNAVERLPTSLARAQAMVDAQHRYFAKVQARQAS